MRDARTAHKQIREAVNIYRIAHGGDSTDAGPLTRTRIVEAVRRVKRNAARAIRSNYDETWLDRLDDALSVRMAFLHDLHDAMRRQGNDIYGLNRRIYARSLACADEAAIEALANINVSAVVPQSTHPDPPLTRLVPDLMPVWKRVTGTSPYPKNARDGGKICPFADWIGGLIKAAGLNPPPQNSVALLVRRRKKSK